MLLKILQTQDPSRQVPQVVSLQEAIDARVKAAKERGIVSGDRISIVSSEISSVMASFFACARLGAIGVPLDPALPNVTRHRYSQWLQWKMEWVDGSHFAPNTLVPAEAQMEFKRLHEDPDPDRPLWMVFTSGTTGGEKAVVIGWHSCATQIPALIHRMQVTAADRFMTWLPPYHLLGLMAGGLVPLAAGASVVQGHLDAEVDTLGSSFGASLAQEKITYGLTVPAHLQFLSRAKAIPTGESLPAFRGFICGGAPLSDALWKQYQSQGIAVYPGYGMTETGPVISVNGPGASKLGTVGQPLPGWSVDIDPDTDELYVSGEHMALGYWQGPDQPFLPLWEDLEGRPSAFLTGDQARIDHEGYITLTGRTKTCLVLGSGKKMDPETAATDFISHIGAVDVCFLSSPTGVMAVVYDPNIPFPSPSTPQSHTAPFAPMPPQWFAQHPTLWDAIHPSLRPNAWWLSREALPKTALGKVNRPVLLLLIQGWMWETQNLEGTNLSC